MCAVARRLTTRETETLALIWQRQSITVREIAKRFGLSGLNAIQDRLNSLRRKGYLAWPEPRKARALRVRRFYGPGFSVTHATNCPGCNLEHFCAAGYCGACSRRLAL
jgi:SOS-response transcriptional repressor LexA